MRARLRPATQGDDNAQYIHAKVLHHQTSTIGPFKCPMPIMEACSPSHSVCHLLPFEFVSLAAWTRDQDSDHLDHRQMWPYTCT